MRRLRFLGRVLNRSLLAVVAVAVVGALVVFNPMRWFADDGDTEADSVAVRDRDELAVTSLRRTVEAEGVLQFTGSTVAVAASANGGGTVTSVIAVGEPVGAGDVLFEVDGVPTVAFTGAVPVWRTMTVDDVGTDVAQLEAGLVALGYDPDGLMTVDETFTSYTAELVSQWQADLGRDETGVADLGSLVFVDEAGRVTSTLLSVGDGLSGAATTPMLTVSATERELVFTVAAADVDTVEVGTEVTARMPDRTSVTAVVTTVAAGADGSRLVTALPVTDNDAGDGGDAALPDGESVPISLSWTVPVATDVVTVQASALTRLDRGGYALEVVTGADTTEFVTVEVGAQSGSTVEVITDLAPGTVVISP